MRLKTWLVAALGLGSLVALIVASMLAASRKAQEIYTQLDELNSHHRRVESRLRALRSDVHLSSVFVRDYLLDVARERAPNYRERLTEFRRTNKDTISELEGVISRQDQVASLRSKLHDYWTTYDPLFDWSTSEKIIRSASFLRKEVVPRREAVLAIAREIEELNNSNLGAQREEVARRQATFRTDLHTLMWQTVLLGLVVAVIVVARLRVLERRSERAEGQMRELSQQLVNAQEEERKNLSRELHDHVAQVLTGLRMELSRIERSSGGAGPAVAECKKLVDDLFSTVRSLALGLRPSMLDDFGLEAALEWHVRDLMARYALNVDLRVTGAVDAVPEKHRTCVYRVVQEATTNCVRHSGANRIQILVTARAASLEVLVIDDGIGVDLARRREGLGLRGISERAKDLQGTMRISREGRCGTRLTVRLPLPDPMLATPLTRVAG